jgi:hypothetical protein
MSNLKRLKLTDAYPFLLGIYPILALMAHNLGYVNFSTITRMLIFTLLVTLILIVIGSVLFKDKEKGKIFATVLLLFFLSYGQVYLFIADKTGKPVHHSILLTLFGLLFLACIWFLIRTPKISATLIQFLTVVSIVSFIITLFPIARSGIQDSIASAQNNKSTPVATVSKDTPLPDVYFIVLDSYTNAEVLQQIYGYDNTPFVDKLRSLGFYVADCSRSNYPITKYSVNSIMNLNYLTDLPDGQIQTPLKQSVVVKTLRSLGYSVYSFENRSKGHFELDEDKVFSRNNQAFGLDLFSSGLNEYESMLLETTAFRLVLDMPQLLPGFEVMRAEYYEHYLQVKYTLDKLPDLPMEKGPKLAFVHILVPHEPYVFTPDGEYHRTDNQYKGYVSNVSYLNNRLPQILADIISRSKIPPIIIVQGDHGPNRQPVVPQIRHSILNAYYVKDAAKSELYSTITPVNSFRIIFNNYFQTGYKLLPDKSYFAYTPEEMTDEKVIPNNCGSSIPHLGN